MAYNHHILRLRMTRSPSFTVVSHVVPGACDEFTCSAAISACEKGTDGVGTAGLPLGPMGYDTSMVASASTHGDSWHHHRIENLASTSRDPQGDGDENPTRKASGTPTVAAGGFQWPMALDLFWWLERTSPVIRTFGSWCSQLPPLAPSSPRASLGHGIPKHPMVTTELAMVAVDCCGLSRESSVPSPTTINNH